MIAAVVYILCGLTSVLCSALLARRYRANRGPLLFWSAWGFVFLAISNILLFVDMIILPTQVDLGPLRHLLTLVGMLMLIYGLNRGND
ncbi:MAG TPA: DUF5985 family protein [Verrucomicrobiae bacterium]|jgi:hypothetical protein|nr:DUF5985 family protein [Verrucomicrobiae bacterium]